MTSKQGTGNLDMKENFAAAKGSKPSPLNSTGKVGPDITKKAAREYPAPTKLTRKAPWAPKTQKGAEEIGDSFSQHVADAAESMAASHPPNSTQSMPDGIAAT